MDQKISAIKKGQKYKHYKNKRMYVVTGISTIKHNDRNIDGSPLVNYKDIKTGEEFSRLYSEFNGVVWVDGERPISKFSRVDGDKDHPINVSDVPNPPKGDML